jgi:hypothetical protein
MVYFASRRTSCRSLRLFAASLLALVAAASAADAGPARPAPLLAPPAGTVINVSTEAQLQSAMASIASNVTIVLAPGTYRLTRTLYFSGYSNKLTNVGIRGATGNSEDVVIVGAGMTESNYGSVPYGIWAGDGVDGITVANLTLREFYFHPIVFNAGTQRPHVYNVHLIDAGQQFIKSNPDAAGVGASDGVVEYSVFEFTTTARDDYPKAIDVHGGANWRIRNNLFRNLQAPAGQLIGPAVLVWRGSSNTITEGNTFLNCGRGVMYGAEDAPGLAHSGGIIRNNFFYRAPNQYGDVGIQVADSPNTQVINNTILLSGTYRASIEYRYPGANGLLIANNLTDTGMWARDGATATLAANVSTASPSMFIDATAGDLHLQASATAAIDQAIPVAGLADDWDGDARPGGTAVDIGADEYVAPVVPLQISGHVTSAATGAALPGVVLTLSGTGSGTATTDGNGTYSFAGLAAGGNYTITPAAEGHSFTPPAQYYFPLATTTSGADFFATPVATVNQPPSVTLSASATAVTVGTRLTLTAVASDADSGVASVAFYVDQKLLATDAARPYSVTWKPGKAGTYTLVAVATDAAGATATSMPVVVTVSAKTRR